MSSTESWWKVYLLKDLVILDRGATAHICNDRESMSDVRPLEDDVVVYSRDTLLRPEEIGTMVIRLRTPRENIKELHAADALFISTFHTGCTSESLLRSRKFWVHGWTLELFYGDPATYRPSLASSFERTI